MNLKDRDKYVTELDKPVVFFDGYCGLCNHFLDFILKRDRSNKFYYAPLQGETAKRFLPELDGDTEEWTMYYLDENGLYERSTATLEILKRLGGGFGVIGYLTVIPRFIRDPIYRLIARNRYKWFGKRDTCRLPMPEESERFLD